MNQEEFIFKEKQDPKKGQGVSRTAIAVFAVILLVAILLSVLITFSLTVTRFTSGESDTSYRFRVIKQYLDDTAYFDPDYDLMLTEALRAYVSAAGDPYTEYYDAEDFAIMNDTNAGHYVGIGITVEQAQVNYQDRVCNVIRVLTIREGSGAEAAGILLEDEIYGIVKDGETVLINDISYTAATSMIRGEADTSVELILLRIVDGVKTEIKVEVFRKEITTEAVSFYISETDPSVGIISITTFDLTTPMGLKKAMDSLIKQGIGRFIIDLRDNGGGDLASVIACASYFLNEGDRILSTEDKNGHGEIYETEVIRYGGEYASCSVTAQEIGMYRNYQYALLVNGNTASAAELLTAVFRDYELGITVGEKTYGKGSMQTIYPLSQHGVEGGVKVTTRMYFPPCGEGYNGIGITPNVVVALPQGTLPSTLAEGDDPQLLSAIEELENKE